MKIRLIVFLGTVAACAGTWAWIANSHSHSEDGTSATPTSTAAPTAGSISSASSAFHDTWLLKPPAGAKVAVYEFDDLECPHCAYALPILHAAAEHYKVPLIHRDFPLTEIHEWSFDAAVTARHINDAISPQLADAFRHDVFAHQAVIANKDDLVRYTGLWFQAHNLAMPFVMDPSGACRNEVRADRALGNRIGVHSTPCIFVVTQQGCQHVEDVNRLGPMIEAALAQTSADTRPIGTWNQRS